MDRNAAINKLEGLIAAGRQSMHSGLNAILDEYAQRRDVIVRPEALDYVVDAEGVRPVIENEILRTTDHSRGQLLARADIPVRFADRLVELGEFDLLKDNLRRLVPRVSDRGILVREVDSLAKGILSSAYKRMDAGPIFQAFVEKGLANGFVPYRGMNTSTQYNLSMIDTLIREPMANEFVVHGINIRTSDYGSGALEFNIMLLRIICSNLAVGMDVLRKVHLGGRFNIEGHGPIIELSKQTHELDSQTIASAIGDGVEQSRLMIQTLDEQIAAAAQREANVNDFVANLRKKGYRKELAENVKATFENKALPVEVLPQEDSAWRLSNVLSLLAQNESDDVKLGLEREAFDLVQKAA